MDWPVSVTKHYICLTFLVRAAINEGCFVFFIVQTTIIIHIQLNWTVCAFADVTKQPVLCTIHTSLIHALVINEATAIGDRLVAFVNNLLGNSYLMANGGRKNINTNSLPLKYHQTQCSWTANLTFTQAHKWHRLVSNSIIRLGWNLLGKKAVVILSCTHAVLCSWSHLYCG